MQGAFEITYTLVIPLLLLFSLMVATSVVMDGITEEMETGTLDDLLAAPVGARAVVLAKTLPIAGLTVAQVLLWTAVLRFQGIAVHNLGLLFAYLALVLLFFTGLGVVTASLARTRRSSHALYGIFLLGFVYLTFVGGPLALYSPANLIAAIVSNPVVPGAVWGRVAASGLVALAVYLAGFAAFGRAVEG